MTMPKPPFVILAAGGTAGHVYPADALATELLKRGVRLALITDKRGGNYSGSLGGVETYKISAGGIAGKGLRGKITSGIELLIGLWQARNLIQKLRPDVVVGFGGYASVPTVLAACFKKIATAIHEQNAVLGRANKLLATRVDKIGTCFSFLDGIPASLKNHIEQTGMPTRPALMSVREIPYPELSVDTQINLIITGGSQGARVFSDVVPEAIARLSPELKARLQITQQCRPEDIERVTEIYKKMGVKAELNNFFTDIPDRLARAHLVIGRAGASTAGEITMAGRPAILVPYPFAIDDHQTRNAYAIDEVGAGWLMPEKSFTAETLATRLQALFDMPATLVQAAANAKKAGAPDATEKLANMVMGLLTQKESKTV